MLFVRGQYIRMCDGKAVMKTLDNRHGQNDFAVFMRFEDTEYGVGHIPDDGGFLLNIGAYLVDFIVFHDCARAGEKW